ncbi:CUB and sushi domain-containing protein 1 [Holothuria leucospilota]|uniref:CUB and sushi domain-containing protein 1 n=1 Tax=Holothuria leucospilota TaxID=206669 RepID=A0A9Q1H4N9_HOLLE|nr:CUB and sushi domain-containing protein 1 [Holothuria leucospilota]
MPSTDDDMVEISPNKSEYQHNETVTFACPDGYELIGDKTEICQFGVWDGQLEPSCHIENISCERFSLEDGLVILDPDYPKYPNGTIVYFECPEGYSLVGNSSTTCLVASWDLYKEPECFALPCGRPSLDDDRVEIEPNSTEYEHNDTVAFLCPVGYNLTGAANAMCQLGAWDTALNQTCQPSPCDKPSPDDTRVAPIPNNAEYQHNDTVELSCPVGYYLIGNPNAICQFGTWNTEFNQTCRPSPCDKPNPDDTTVEITPDNAVYQHNDTVTFSCPSGFKLEGTSSAICQLGVWDTELKHTCRPSPCEKPSLDDTRMEIMPDNTEFQHNETVMFSCPSGYDLKGDSSAICQFGIWEMGTEPTCTVKECANPYPEDYNVIMEPYKYRYENGSTVLYSCPEGLTRSGSSSATCMFGEWLPSEDPPSCEDTISEFCNSSSLKSKDEISYTPEYETYSKGEEVYLKCRNSEMCQTNSQRVCDKETRLCLCSPGLEPFEGVCIETIAVVTEVSLDAHFNETLADNSSKEFLDLQKQVCFAFEYTLTNRSSNVKNGYVSCYVESFSNGSIITDVVTKYKKEENVTPQQVEDIIATEAEQQEHYTIPYLILNFTLDSEIKSEVRDLPLALTVGLGVGVALCFVIILVTSIVIFGRHTEYDDSKTISSQDSNDDNDETDLLPPYSPRDDLSKHNSFDTSFVNHGYSSDEYMSGGLDSVSETAKMSAIANIIQNMGKMEPMPRIKPPPGNNHNQIMTDL